MEARPKITIKPTPVDITIEIMAWLVLVLLWIYVTINYQSLPEIVPTHWGLNGKIDAYGSKDTVFMGPGFATILVIAMTFLQRMPYTFNYIEEITLENAKRQYTIAVRTVRVLKVFIGLVFMIIEFSTTMAAANEDTIDLKWLFIGIFVLLQLPIFYFATLALKKK